MSKVVPCAHELPPSPGEEPARSAHQDAVDAATCVSSAV
jgi:hypothetical protein